VPLDRAENPSTEALHTWFVNMLTDISREAQHDSGKILAPVRVES
jgi:hypothetical protein